MVDVEEIIREAARENKARKDYVLAVNFSLGVAIAVIGQLQLSLRHPDNDGKSARLVREVVDGLIAQLLIDGFPACASVAALGDDPAAAADVTTLSIRTDAGWVPIDGLDPRATAAPLGDLTLESVRAGLEAMKELTNGMREQMFRTMSLPAFFLRPALPTEGEFEALNAEIARRGPTFEVDVAGRCMVCGLFGCAWWAAFCAWRAGQGPRPNWRDGSIDATCSEVGAQVLIESSSMK